jgi:hypothetical protein
MFLYVTCFKLPFSVLSYELFQIFFSVLSYEFGNLFFQNYRTRYGVTRVHEVRLLF